MLAPVTLLTAWLARQMAGFLGVCPPSEHQAGGESREGSNGRGAVGVGRSSRARTDIGPVHRRRGQNHRPGSAAAVCSAVVRPHGGGRVHDGDARDRRPPARPSGWNRHSSIRRRPGPGMGMTAASR
jgi:hypothetical protein